MVNRIKKEERIEARLPAEAKRTIEFAAGLQGRSVSDFVVAASLEHASKIIEQEKIIKLSMEDSIALAEALLTPPKPNRKAIEAARRYKKLMGL